MSDLRPPSLPAGAPPDLVAFVACRRDCCELTNGKIPWLPAPAAVPRRFKRFLAPSLTVRPTDGNPAGADLAVGWGPVKLHLRAAVTAEGLVLSAAGTPPPGLSVVVAGFDSWATDLNRWLASRGRRLGRPRVAPGRLVLVKEDCER